MESDKIQQKLAMSLDDLIKKEGGTDDGIGGGSQGRQQHPRRQNDSRGGGSRGGFRGGRGAGGRGFTVVGSGGGGGFGQGGGGGGGRGGGGFRGPQQGPGGFGHPYIEQQRRPDFTPNAVPVRYMWAPDGGELRVQAMGSDLVVVSAGGACRRVFAIWLRRMGACVRARK